MIENDSITDQITKASNEIWKNTRISKDNWIIASPKIFSHVAGSWSYRDMTLRDFIDSHNPGYVRK